VTEITTPHIIQHVWDNTHEGIASKKVETIQQLEKNNITIPFQAAAEYLMDDHLYDFSIS
jgi:tyrosine-protein phosphatase YwqE